MRCPFTGRSSVDINLNEDMNNKLFPKQLNLNILHQNSNLSNPMRSKFNYPKEFCKLDYYALKKRFI